MNGMRRLAALALAGLLLTATLAAEAHRIVALHAVCARHGELIHIEGGTRTTLVAPAMPTLASDTSVALEGAHGCVALRFLATAYVGPAPAAPPPAPRAAPVHRDGPPTAAGLPSVLLLLQAPKQSPPVT